MNVSIIKEAWKSERIKYQQRYYNYYKKYLEDSKNRDTRGHMHECSYVLISIFGLTDKQVIQIEKNGGYTNEDLEDPEV